MLEDAKIAVLGGGSWATALAKIVMTNDRSINWYIRRQDQIDEFIATGMNPSYLSSTRFDVSKISFSTDINAIIRDSDILILAIPSPYLKQSLKKVKRSLRRKIIVSAVKGMVPDENMTVTDYIHLKYDVPYENLAVIAGPCHAEEVVMDRLSYLTLGCEDRTKAVALCEIFRNRTVKVSPGCDVVGMEYSSVMKNIYAIAAGLCHTLKYGDNFQAVLMCNAIQEIRRFIIAATKGTRDIDASAYLGDVLVTAYSKFSRNRQFGHMLGMGYSIKTAQLEMEMVAEGYYGVKCIHDFNEHMQVSIPIVDAMYDILYNHKSPIVVIKDLTNKLS